MAIVPTINDIREITEVLSKQLKMDYSNYAFSFLRRRVASVYNILKVKTSESFIADLRKGNLIEDFCYVFPVKENELFRDPSFWRLLRTRLLTELGDNLNFWFPELVSSEELLSLLIILDEEKLLDKSKIFCNVNSLRRIEEIKQGKIGIKNVEINKTNFKRVELHSKFEDYFVEVNGFDIVREGLMGKVVFLSDNYFNILPDVAVDVTLFRNRMLYYNSKLQGQVENYLSGILAKGSFLSLGIKEQISKENQCLFELFDSGEQIYKVS